MPLQDTLSNDGNHLMYELEDIHRNNQSGHYLYPWVNFQIE